MGKTTVVPFGPQHPALPEPIHLDLELDGETVVRAVPSIGYIHRGLEKLAESYDYNAMTYVMERVCGICSFGHSWGYTAAVEGLMGVEVPDRAEYLRTVFHELSRVHSHLLWLGLLADGMGFESLFMQCWRLREQVLDLFEMTTGGRVIMSFSKVGGLKKDLTPEMVAAVSGTVRKLRPEVSRIADVFLNDSSVRSRMHGVGRISRQEALELCAVGPVARGSGLNNDVRCSGIGRYREIGFEPVLEKDGDCAARCAVRIGELFQSFDMIETATDMMPAGDVSVPVKGNPPAGEFVMRMEQPRGDAFYYVRGNGTKNLDRVRVRTPTNANIPVLVKALQGCQMNDVTMLVLTLDPCVSCTER
jgi:ech hydrogenase subunit E